MAKAVRSKVHGPKSSRIRRAKQARPNKIGRHAPVDPDNRAPVDPDNRSPVDPDNRAPVDPDNRSPVDPDNRFPDAGSPRRAGRIKKKHISYSVDFSGLVNSKGRIKRRDSLIRALIHPLSPDEFFSRYWEKKIWLAPSSDETRKLTQLISIADIESRLQTMDLRCPTISLAKNGRRIPEERFSRLYKSRDSVVNYVDRQAVIELRNRGASLILQSLDFWDSLIQTFCRALSRELNSSVHANAYLTPPKSNGLDIHYDTHDVFIIQIEGEKSWQIYESSEYLPPPNRRYVPKGVKRGKIVLRKTLVPGDVLYIPRGYLHKAVANSQASLHLTIGVFAKSWADLLKEAVQIVDENPTLRQSIVGALLFSDRKASKQKIAKAQKEILKILNLRNLLKSTK